MSKFERSWQLFKTSVLVMQRDMRLLLFPIITATATVVVALLFLLPVAFQRTGYGVLSARHWQAVGSSIGAVNFSDDTRARTAEDPAGFSRSRSVQRHGLKPLAAGYFAAMYFVSMFCATFFNVAFYCEILKALKGEPVSIAGGIQFACSKWKTILMWTLFAGLVGYIIQRLEQRFGFVGQLVMRIIGTAWSIACIFVIPIIITEEQTSNPLAVLKKSALTLKQTWGESLIGYLGVSFGGALVGLISVLWLGGGIAIALSLHLYLLIPLVVLVWLACILAWSYLLSVASQIFRCALFLYAAQGALPDPYTPEMMALAWKVKKS
ncbi:MAG: DUF6159 family protein [Limisphaerales bacterium]